MPSARVYVGASGVNCLVLIDEEFRNIFISSHLYVQSTVLSNVML